MNGDERCACGHTYDEHAVIGCLAAACVCEAFEPMVGARIDLPLAPPPGASQ